MSLPSLGRSGWTLALAALTGIAVIFAAFAVAGVAERKERRYELHAAELRALLATEAEVQKLLLDVETASRGYVLTGSPAFLQPYFSARRQLPDELARLERLTTNRSQATMAARIEALADAKVEHAASVVSAFDQGARRQAEALVLEGTGRRVMDELRSLIRRAEAESRRELRSLADQARTAARTATIVSLTAALLLMLVSGAMLYLIGQRARRDRQRLADAEAREALLAELAHHSVHDALTGLPNRRLLEDRIGQALGRSTMDGTLLAVLFIGVDRFKLVNDRHGHAVGDKLLTTIADALRSAVRPTDTVARVGGDEFVVLCEQLPDHASALALVELVQERLNRQFVISGVSVDATVSVGVVVASHAGIVMDDDQPSTHVPQPTAKPSPQMLMSAAGEAMDQAKKLGRARYELYSAELQRGMHRRVNLLEQLQAALAGDEATGGRLWVAYQPLIRLSDAQATGVEALARWTHPELGNVPPGDFIPLAEEAGLIGALGRVITDTACRDVGAWNRTRAAAGLQPLYVSVNCSAREFLDADFTERLKTALQRGGLAAQSLVLELTETVLVDAVGGGAARLEEIIDAGVRLALDDFGTGYSSLAYLRCRLP